MYENTVELLGYYGGDLQHAMSAWTSTSRDLDEEKIARIPKLLKMLAEAGHHTPFEKSSLHFLVTTDIASHIHIIKHRIGVSVNGESGRYKELKEDKFLLPEDWIGIKCTAKGYQYDQDGEDKFGDNWLDILKTYTELGNKLYHDCLEDLTSILGRQRAKESARYFKGYNSQITADIMFNFRSFAHFLSLRNKDAAQKEIREIAVKMLELVKNIDGNPFKETVLAFGL